MIKLIKQEFAALPWVILGVLMLLFTMFVSDLTDKIFSRKR